MSHYARGAAFERKVRDDLQARGYLAVRSAGSRGLVDVLAVQVGSVLLVQCRLSGRISFVERRALTSAASLAGGVALLAQPGERGAVTYAPVTREAA